MTKFWLLSHLPECYLSPEYLHSRSCPDQSPGIYSLFSSPHLIPSPSPILVLLLKYILNPNTYTPFPGAIYRHLFHDHLTGLCSVICCCFCGRDLTGKLLGEQGVLAEQSWLLREALHRTSVLLLAGAGGWSAEHSRVGEVLILIRIFLIFIL